MTLASPPKVMEAPAEGFRRGLLDRAILVLIGVLLVEVLLEGWLVTVFGGVDADGDVIQAQWPKTLKIALYLTLFVLTVVKITADKRWGSFRTKADMAIVVLGVVLTISGVLGGSDAGLIFDALFVYFRGAIIFYAVRAVRPDWTQARPFAWAVGGVVALNCLLAIVQLVGGTAAYRALGWVNLQWADEGRAQGLLEHPNDLGHVTGLALLALVAWIAVADRVAKRWWALLIILGFVLGIAQSRHSTIAALAGVVVIAGLNRAHWKRMAAAVVAIGALSALPIALDADRRAGLMIRFEGFFRAIGVDVEHRDPCAFDPRCEETAGEVRVLFIKQGVKLFEHEPVFGYGIGQFGGIVAVRNDPAWNMDPRFVEVLGPLGFHMSKFEAVSVDVFWLHLLVEAGAVGLVAYLVWMALVASPLIGAAWRRAGPARDRAMFLFAVATLGFGLVIAAWSISLEDPLWPPLMFAVLGFAWVCRERVKA
ncbi:O-antigen ligase family protein [Allorhizocola rhizosphaerae]|uniref:O-antigen ligase family protein n=1 Tax=Allorhizocola rhizosphaerae TaxID=1872709 RepID=UPI0013C34528|nr:O-antigen ligase family protein [Allorhizocola rhizosphaerae]